MRRLHQLGINGLQLFALSGFAVAKPLYDLLETDPSVLVVVDATGLALAVTAVVLLLLPPLLLLALEALVSLFGERPLEWAHRVLVGLLVAVFVVQARTSIDALPDGTRSLNLLALAVGVAAAFAYARVAVLRTYLTVLAFAPLIFAGLFLLNGPVSPLVTDAGSVGALDADTAGAPDVVMVVLDELPLASVLDRRGEIDAERYPALARFAGDATWYRNATSVEAFTPWAIPTILDGMKPRPRWYNHSSFHPKSLFTLLGRTHDMNVLEAFTRVCPPSVCRGERSGPLVRGIAAFDALVFPFWKRLVPGSSGERLAEATQWVRARLGAETRTGVSAEDAQLGELLARVGSRDADFQRFLDRVRPRPRRALHYAHLLYPHAPFDHRREGRYDLRHGLAGRNSDWVSRPLADLGLRRHLLQMEFTDQLLERLFDKLRRTGLYDDAAIVVVADHGAHFRVGSRRSPREPSTLEDLAPVPLLIKAPGQTEGRVDEASVRTVDVLPTLAEAIGVTLPWRPDGVPASVRREPGDEIEMTVKGRPGPKAPRSDVEGGMRALRRRLPVSGAGRDRRPLFAERGMAFLVGARTPARLAPHPELTVAFRESRHPGLAVQGDLRGGEGTRMLAFSACDRVLGVAGSYRDEGAERFAALLERAPRPGCPLEVALVDGRRLTAAIPPSP